MEAFAIILQFGFVIFVMANGLAIIVGGPRMAGRLNRWALRTACRVVGGTLTAIGNMISGWGR